MLNMKMKGRLSALKDVSDMMDESEVDEAKPKSVTLSEVESPEEDMNEGGHAQLTPEEMEKLKAMLAAMG